VLLLAPSAPDYFLTLGAWFGQLGWCRADPARERGRCAERVRVHMRTAS